MQLSAYERIGQCQKTLLRKNIQISGKKKKKEEERNDQSLFATSNIERRKKRPLLLRDLETEMVGRSKRASNQANLFNDDAFNNNKSCGGKYALRGYTRIFRVCNARRVPPRVQHVCTMRITTPFRSYVRTSRAVRVACADQGEQIAAANDRDEKNDVVLLVQMYKSSFGKGGERIRSRYELDVCGTM